MPPCTDAVGVNIIGALKKADVWGTPVICGAGDGILIRPHTIKKDRENNVDDSLGLYFARTSNPGAINVLGDLPMYIRYDGIDLLIALAMGATGGAPVIEGDGPGYRQKFTLEDCIKGLFGTLCMDMKANINEYTTVKLTGLSITGEIGGSIMITFKVLAINLVTNSVVNTSITFQSVTVPETGNILQMGSGVFRMNDQSDIALAAGDVVYPQSFTLDLTRTMAGVYGVGTDMDVIDEPTNDGLPEVTMNMTFGRYQSDGYFQDWDANTLKKMDITFTGAEIEPGVNREFKITLPQLSIANVDAPVVDGIIEEPLVMNCLEADTAPAGMTGITKPFQIDVLNEQSTDVLA
jgi:hypothetical protein